MKPKARFIQSVIRAAQDCDTVMPYARSARRAATPAAPRVARSA